MIKKYLDFLLSLFAQMGHRDGNFTFLDYLKTVGLSLGFALMIAGVILLIVLVAIGPVKTWNGWVLKKKKAFLTSVMNNKPDESLRISWHKSIWVYVLGMIFLYIPVVIPTFLYILHVLIAV